MALYSAYMNEFKIALQTLVHYENTSPLFCKTISVRRKRGGGGERRVRKGMRLYQMCQGGSIMVGVQSIEGGELEVCTRAHTNCDSH